MGRFRHFLTRTHAFVSRREFVIDALGAVFILVVILMIRPADSGLSVMQEGGQGLFVDVGSAGYAIWQILLAAPLALRRCSPDLSAWSFLIISICQLILGPVLVPADIAALIIIYSVLVYGERHRFAYIFTAYAMAVLAAASYGISAVFVHQTRPRLEECASTPLKGHLVFCLRGVLFESMQVGVFYLILVTCAIFLGYWNHARRRSFELIRQRNEALEYRNREKEELAASAERARLARDMHDVVAHTLSIIIVQSDAGRYAGPGDPAVALQTMQTIDREGRRALGELNGLFSSMGRMAGGDGEGMKAGPRNQGVGYHSLEELLNEARQASPGCRFERIVTGTPEPDELTDGRMNVAYRVVQEALSNVRKHAGPHVRVIVREQWQVDGLRLDVEDDGRGQAAHLEEDHRGYGLVGMRERVSSVGGRTWSGPQAGGGFRVGAFIPFEAGPDRTLGRRVILTDGTEAEAGTKTGGAADGTDGPAGSNDGIGQVPEGGYRPNLIERVSSWFQRHYVVADAVLAFLLIPLAMSSSPLENIYLSDKRYTPSDSSLVWFTALCILVPLVWRRSHPRGSAAVIAVICALEILFLPWIPVGDILVVISVYSAMTYGNDRDRLWVPLAVLAEVFILQLRLYGEEFHGTGPLIGFLMGMGDGPLTQARNNPEGSYFSLFGFTLACAAICLAAIVASFWKRSQGSSLLLQEQKEEALRLAAREAGLVAANEERSRIGANMQEDVASTLKRVIFLSDQGLAMLGKARARGEDPDPGDVEKAFDVIGREGRQALTRMRQLLTILRETGDSDRGQGGGKTGPALHPVHVATAPSQTPGGQHPLPSRPDDVHSPPREAPVHDGGGR